MSWFVLLDMMVAVLLGVTIFYAIVLNRKLGHLRGNRADLESVTSGFDEAVARAEASVTNLKVSSGDLQDRIGQARSLCDDLEMLIRRAEATADNLEDAVRAGRKQREGSPARPAATTAARPAAASGARPTAAVAVRPAGRGAAAPRSEAERELLRALSS